MSTAVKQPAAEVLSEAEAKQLAQARRLERLGTAQHNEARVFALKIVRDPLYREKLLIFARARRLHPLVEQMLWHYAYGKPPERIELGRIGDAESLEHLTKEELAERAKQLAELILKPPTDVSDEAQAAAQQSTDKALAIRQRLNTPYRERNPDAPLRPKEIGELLEAEGFGDLAEPPLGSGTPEPQP